MKIVEFPSLKSKYECIEELGHEIVDNTFDLWRNEVEIEKNMKFDDMVYLELTTDIWKEVTDIMLGITQDEFEGINKNYVLSLVKQRVSLYKDKVISLLLDNISGEPVVLSETLVNDNVYELSIEETVNIGGKLIVDNVVKFERKSKK